jgi:hypothetical protein
VCAIFQKREKKNEEIIETKNKTSSSKKQWR